MVENLLALPTAKPMTATQLGNFLARDIRPLVSINAKGDKNYLKKMIDKLEQMKQASIQSEERAYEMLGVKSLTELQNELDIVNDQGLFALSNEVLRQMPAVERAKKAYVRVETLREAIQEDFVKYLNKGEGSRTFQELAMDESLNLLAEFAEYEKKHLGVKRGTLVSGFKTSSARGKTKVVGLAFEKFSKTRKKDLKDRLQIKNDVVSVRGGYHEELTITAESGTTLLKYYPYFGLTAEEKEYMLEDDELWERFVEAVSSCVGNALKSDVKTTMKSIMGKGAFIEAGGSYADIVGILGELEALVFLGRLGAKKSIAPRFLGHTKNENEEKIGIDVALYDIGFQVKNYNMYGSREEGNQGINLDGDYKLGNFLDLISENFANPGMRWNLEQFYAATVYHIQKHPDFANIRSWMDKIGRQQLPKLYHGAIGELLPLKQITWVEETIDGNKIKDSGTNAFYIIGGSRILPVSKILSLYIKFLSNLQQNIDSPKLITMRQEDGISYSSKETYANYYENPTGYSFPGYHAIADKIRIHYNINMNIDYSIDEVLTRVLKEGVVI